MRKTKQDLFLLIEPSTDAYLTPAKIGNLFLNRFAIDEDAGFEILGIDFLHHSSRRQVDQLLPLNEILLKRDYKGKGNYTCNHFYECPFGIRSYS